MSSIPINRRSFVTICSCLAVAAAAHGADHQDIRASAERMEQRIEVLSRFGTHGQGVSRVAFSKADIEAREVIRGWLDAVGLEVRLDTAGNIIGKREGSDPDLPVIMFGSHIDSVPGGGNYDGDVGVVAAIEIARLLQDNEVVTRHPLEIVSFTDEEGGLTGSRAMTTGLSENALNVVTHSGMTIGEGIRLVGGDPDRLEEAKRTADEFAAFIEVHIEQGAFLYEEDIDIGVVEGIVGIRWWDVTIEGIANHAGTTPMNRRQDAMISAAQLTLAVNRVATSMEGRQVATVGRIHAEPGAPNVIPGRVVMSLEIRDLDANKMQQVFDAIKIEADKISRARQTPMRFAEIEVASPPAPTDLRMRKIIAQSAEDLGLSYKFMPSGAGHDAQDMTHVAPTGMIFVPSVGGISHSPKEFTSAEDMANGANVLLRTVLAIDQGALD
jgi:beta-ureidopropionase / N-carbamoyl-L-amino-acid hydrolase